MSKQNENDEIQRFKSFDDILEYAIAREMEANKFYLGIAQRTDDSTLKNVFESFAKEELVHKNKLEAMKNHKEFCPAERIGNLKLDDYFVEGRCDSDICIKEAFVLAAKKEAAALKLYTDLAMLAEDKSQKDVFLLLAQEEARHKLYFETAFDDIVLKSSYKDL